ncbi:signal peptide peptidase SppA [bacterium]|nr:signal peptide peptidase SppA [bacterium]
MKRFLIVLAIILAAIFAIVLVGMRVQAHFTGGSTSKIKSGSVLSIDLSESYPERSDYKFKGFSFKKGMNFLTLIRSVEGAATDDDIIALSLKIDGVGLSTSQLQEFSKAVDRFKATGKPVFAFLPSAGMGSYLAAVDADSIFIPPSGDFLLLGMAIMPMFYAGTAEKLGIGFDVIKFGKYKGAAEMFTQTGFSEPLRESYSDLLDGLFGQWVSTVAARRKIEKDDVVSIVNRGVFDAEDGVELGLADGLIYPQDYRKKILALVDDDEDRVVGLSTYASNHNFDSGKRKIAVVYCLGNIHMGESKSSPFKSNRSIGDDTFVEAIDDAAKNDDVEAIVLRVDSPGGSALASDIIWKSIIDAKKKKPVLVSMGRVAASGGYYISAPADSIFCDAATITGSIGVIFLKLNAEGLFKKIGVTVDTITRGSLADDFSIHKAMDPEAYEAFRKTTESVYRDFTTKAAEGRGLELDSLLKLAAGRVWIGSDAVDNHLADRIASFSEAIDVAARMAKIPKEDLGIVSYPKEKSLFDMAFEVYENPPKAKLNLPAPLEKAVMPSIEAMELFRPGEPLALMPYTVTTH